jgi:predicted nucleic acid-binding protein
VDAFDADVLIYAASVGHPLGRRVRRLFLADPLGEDDVVGLGSVLLVPELLSKPIRDGLDLERSELEALLGRLDLLPVDLVVAPLATVLGATYRLRAPDAVHLATAVAAGAERFITNNRGDFPQSISEIDVVYPDELPAG